MRNRDEARIEERLIGDSLTEHIDRVDDTRDLWPGIRDRLHQRRQTRFPVIARVAAATGVVALLALLVIVRPWSLFDDSMTPFAAVAHAYDGMLELETIRYRVDATNSSGQEFKEIHQVDMVNRIEHSVSRIDMSSVPGPVVGAASRQEFLRINGKHYIRLQGATVEDFGPEVQTYESSETGWGLFPDAMRPSEGRLPLGALREIRRASLESRERRRVVRQCRTRWGHSGRWTARCTLPGIQIVRAQGRK